MLDWMAWTAPTATFFVAIFVLLCAMTVWEIYQPSVERRGLLPIATSRGDRLFIGLLSSAYIHLAWIAFADAPLWYALGIAIVWMVLVMRFG